ncbi:MAG TPA: hypothetical protein VG929_07015 [Actinomycetota bacterium]|nr:hypothetical protein [Actinomycetota bacterium]
MTPRWIDPAWRKAPLLLLRFPAILGSVVAAAVILGVTTAAAPLLLSSAANAAVAQELDQYGPALAGVSFSTFGFIEGDKFRPADSEVLRATGAVPEVGEPTTMIKSATTGIETRAGEAQVRLLFRTGAVRNIDKLTTRRGLPGGWIARSTADALRVGPGDHVVLESFRARRKIPIAGIYRDLASAPLSDYWAPLTYDIINEIPNQPPLRPYMILPRDQLFDATQGMDQQGTFSWDFPLVDRVMTMPQAIRTEAAIGELKLEASDPLTPLGGALADLTLYGTLDVRTSLTAAIASSEETVTAVEGPVRLISLAARIVALVVIGAAGIFAHSTRRREARLLSAQGRTPWWQGTKSSVEAALPAATGGVVGWFIAIELVQRAGPAPTISAGVTRDALVEVGWWIVAAVVVMGFVYAFGTHQETQIGASRLRRAVAKIPWEVVVLVLAAASFYELAARQDPIVQATDEPASIDMLLLAFPFLFLAGMGGLVVRGLGRLLPRMRRGAATARPWRYLAVRRFAATQKAGLLVINSAAVAVGILVYSGTLVDTTATTVRAKAHILAGSETAVAVQNVEDVPADIDLDWTHVAIGSADLLPGEERIDVLSLDPTTFARGAFWDPTFADRPLGDLLADLVRGGDRVPVILAGIETPRHSTVEARGRHLPIEVIETVRAWPGMSPNKPMMIVDGETYTRVARAAGATATDPFASDQVWAKDDPDVVLEALEDEQVFVQYHRAARDVEASPPFRSLFWTFGFLQALGVLAGGLALVGVVLYVQSRQASRDVSYALARRMGLSPSSHRVAIGAELVAILAISFAIGAALALTAAALVVDKIDPLPALPPDPLFRVPAALVAGSCGVLVFVAVAGAWLVQQRTDRMSVAEVMRLAT